MAEVSTKKNLIFYLHVFIGLLLMFGFRLLPPFDPITPIGMSVLGIFLGMIYLWTVADTVWPSLLGLVALEITGCASIAEIYVGGFGDKIAVLLLFSMMFFGIIQDANIPNYMGQWFLKLKISHGRPLVFCFIFIFGVYVLSALTGILGALLIFWPILYSVVDKLGYGRQEAFVPIMMVGTFFGAALGQPALPIKGGNLIVIAAFQKVSGIEINGMAYVLYNIGISLVLILMYVLLIKWVFRPNLGRLAQIDANFFAKDALPPMSKQQKVLSALLVIYLAVTLLSGVLPKTWAPVAFLKALDTSGITIIFVVLLCLIRLEGKPLFNIKQAGKHVNWSVYCLITVVLFISTLLTADSTGIKPFLVKILNPILGGKGTFLFAFLVLVIAVIVTNFANNAVVGAILAPVIFAFSEQMHFNPIPLTVVMTMIVFFLAFLTPAASPYAAMLHGNSEWVSAKDIYKYGGITIVLGVLVCTVVGVPLATFLFGLF